MILLYTLLVLFLAALAFVLNGRVRGLERRYTKAALAVEGLAERVEVKPGNRTRNHCTHAKWQYDLGRLAHRRDRIEEKYSVWSQRAEAVERWLAAVKRWRGKKLPYTSGALDVALLFYLVDRYGVNQVQLAQMVETVRGYLGV